MQRTTSTVLAALLAASFCQAVRGQEQESKTTDVGHLAAQAKVRIGKAITIACQARPGVATGAELETMQVGDATVPCFEIMVRGDDHSVYEVRVHAGNGKVLANAVCTDKEDIAEAEAAAAKTPAVTLASVVAEARALLRGTCIAATLVAKRDRVEVELWNGGRRVQAGFQMADGQLALVTCKPAPRADLAKAGKQDDDEENEAAAHGETSHGDDDDDDDEHEEHGADRDDDDDD